MILWAQSDVGFLGVIRDPKTAHTSIYRNSQGIDFKQKCVIDDLTLFEVQTPRLDRRCFEAPRRHCTCPSPHRMTILECLAPVSETYHALTSPTIPPAFCPLSHHPSTCLRDFRFACECTSVFWLDPVIGSRAHLIVLSDVIAIHIEVKATCSCWWWTPVL